MTTSVSECREDSKENDACQQRGCIGENFSFRRAAQVLYFRFVTMKDRTVIKVPATSANMGPVHRITDPNLTDGIAKAGSLKDPEVISDVNATVDFMLANSAIDSQRIGITGFCMGGRVSWLAAAVNPNFKAAAPYYGGNLMVIRGDAEKSPFELASGINCPILFHFGEIDANPSQDDMRVLDDELTKLGKPHQFFVYPHADHAFADHTGARYHRESAEVSWPRTLDFFAAHLKGVPATG